MSVTTLPAQLCSAKAPCGAQHCFMCVKGTAHWFHIPPGFAVGQRRHAKRGPVRRYFGF